MLAVGSNGVEVHSETRALKTAQQWLVVEVSQNGNDATGLLIDFDKGRVILKNEMGSSLTISGNFDRKTVNSYITNESEEELLRRQEPREPQLLRSGSTAGCGRAKPDER